jgi:hypothetical protein
MTAMFFRRLDLFAKECCLFIFTRRRDSDESLGATRRYAVLGLRISSKTVELGLITTVHAEDLQNRLKNRI